MCKLKTTLQPVDTNCCRFPKVNDVKIEELYQDSGVSYNVLLQTFDHATAGDGLDVLLVLPDPGDGGPAQDT